jgi:hypothetical protein
MKLQAAARLQLTAAPEASLEKNWPLADYLRSLPGVQEEDYKQSGGSSSRLARDKFVFSTPKGALKAVYTSGLGWTLSGKGLAAIDLKKLAQAAKGAWVHYYASSKDAQPTESYKF